MTDPIPREGAPSDAITIRSYPKAVTVKFGDMVVASTSRALELVERGHAPVLYIPFDDIYFVHLLESETKTRCPLKGDASYWSVTGLGNVAKDAMWAYNAPLPEIAAIRDHGAFDPRKVSIDAGDDHTARPASADGETGPAA